MRKKISFFLMTVLICFSLTSVNMFALMNRNNGLGRNATNYRKGYEMRNFGRGMGRCARRRGCGFARGFRNGSGPNTNCPLKDQELENRNLRELRRDGKGPHRDGRGPRGTGLGPSENCPNK